MFWAPQQSAVMVRCRPPPLRPAVYPPPSSGQAPLELRGVGFSYGLDPRWGSRHVTRNRCAGAAEPGPHRAPGEIIAVTGPNGAGKSTLLRHINGLLRPSEGDVRVCGRSIAGVPVGTVAASVGLLFQHPRDQLFERTVLREAAFGLRLLFGKAEAEYRARAALAAVGFTRLTRPSTRPNCPPRSSGCSPWPRCWHASRPCWPWTSRP